MPGQTPEGATSVSFEDQNVLGFQPYTQPAPNPTEILSIFSGTAVLMFDGYVPGAVQFCSFEIPQDPEGTPYTLLDDPQHGLPVRLTGIAYPLNPPGVSFLYQRVRIESLQISENDPPYVVFKVDFEFTAGDLSKTPLKVAYNVAITHYEPFL
jgi:hypothetical protein